MIIIRGKSGLRGKGCQVTPGHCSNSDGKCHRKQTAPKGVRVKRWGKSPPRSWQHGWLGKPRLEQGQVSGESTHLDQDAAGRLLEGTSDRAPREMTVTVFTLDRTRLTDRSLDMQQPFTELSVEGCLFFQFPDVDECFKPVTPSGV